MQKARTLKKGAFGKEASRLIKTIGRPLTFEEKRNRFYAWTRSYQKAEFIDGRIVIDSPVRARHLWVSTRLVALLRSAIARFKPGGKVGVEKGLIPFTKNDFEPDVCYWEPEKAQKIGDKQWRLPIPDFIVEILSPDSGKRDRGIKKEEYEKHKVTEYWIIDPEENQIERYILNPEGKYILQTDEGLVSFSLMPDFVFTKNALFSDEETDQATNKLAYSKIQADLEAAQDEARVAQDELKRIKDEKAQQMRTFIVYLREQGMTEAQISTITSLSVDEIARLFE